MSTPYPLSAAHSVGPRELPLVSADIPVRTDLHTVREILRIKEAFEPGYHPVAGAESYWSEMLAGLAESEVLEAVWAHFRSSRRELWPADVFCRLNTPSPEHRSQHGHELRGAS